MTSTLHVIPPPRSFLSSPLQRRARQGNGWRQSGAQPPAAGPYTGRGARTAGLTGDRTRDYTVKCFFTISALNSLLLPATTTAPLAIPTYFSARRAAKWSPLLGQQNRKPSGILKSDNHVFNLIHNRRLNPFSRLIEQEQLWIQRQPARFAFRAIKRPQKSEASPVPAELNAREDFHLSDCRLSLGDKTCSGATPQGVF
jgi:hypothetical protein